MSVNDDSEEERRIYLKSLSSQSFVHDKEGGEGGNYSIP